MDVSYSIVSRNVGPHTVRSFGTHFLTLRCFLAFREGSHLHIFCTMGGLGGFALDMGNGCAGVRARSMYGGIRCTV